VTDLDVAERKALFMLFTESRIDPNAAEAAGRLNSEYHSGIPHHLLEPAFQKWVNEGWAKADRSGPAPRFRLRRDRFAEAYRRILELFNASSITVYPDTREIVSDISPTNDFPIREGWKWLTYQSEEPPESSKLYGHNQNLIAPSPSAKGRLGPVDWTKWGTIIAAVGIIVTILLWAFS
jgi:hypothetical protein